MDLEESLGDQNNEREGPKIEGIKNLKFLAKLSSREIMKSPAMNCKITPGQRNYLGEGPASPRGIGNFTPGGGNHPSMFGPGRTTPKDTPRSEIKTDRASPGIDTKILARQLAAGSTMENSGKVCEWA